MTPTLLVLAAGMGSRYGGLKQVDPVGPNGAIVIDYAIFDAIRAGFGKVVFIIRESMHEQFASRFACLPDGIEVAYAFQDACPLPAGFESPPGREKPWGTGHAVLSAAGQIDGPFCVINADDFYGRQSFDLMAEFLSDSPSDYGMVAFPLIATMSPNGYVSRGVCEVRDGLLSQVVERTRIEHCERGIRMQDGDSWGSLEPDQLVSCNFWGFHNGVFDELDSGFRAFLSDLRNPQKDEFFLPTLIDERVASGDRQVRVMRSEGPWFGVTYQEDKPGVVAGIRELVESGVYPSDLWRQA
ncbi:MAG: NDP-sugar pyrophosphorylase family protein [Rhodothermales bacterium]|jgi:NDP-sugar pyrophosphorylase family protein